MHLENIMPGIVGLMMVMYFIGYGIGGFLTPLADKHGRRPVLLGLLFCNLTV